MPFKKLLKGIVSAAPIIGPIVGGISSAYGQKRANETNIALARENREFQRYMSNTAVRRRMEDMRAGGINPILAGRYDASTPAGSFAQIQNVGAAGMQGAQMGANTGRQVAMVEHEIQQLVERNNLTRKQAEALSAMAELSGAAGDFLRTVREKASEFSFESIDWHNLWTEFTGSFTPPDVTVLIDVLKDQFKVTPGGVADKLIPDNWLDRR